MVETLTVSTKTWKTGGQNWSSLIKFLEKLYKIREKRRKIILKNFQKKFKSYVLGD